MVTQGAYHADHVHEGAFVSGVYYAAVPSGSAPLVLRRPRTDDESEISDESADIFHAPTEGDLVLFPPWVKHGVPVAEEQEEQHNNKANNNVARVSFAFNATGAFALGNDPWDVTRLQ